MITVLAQTGSDLAPSLSNVVVGGVFTFLILMFGWCLRLMVKTQAQADQVSEARVTEIKELKAEREELKDERDRYRELWAECQARERGY